MFVVLCLPVYYSGDDPMVIGTFGTETQAESWKSQFADPEELCPNEHQVLEIQEPNFR